MNLTDEDRERKIIAVLWPHPRASFFIDYPELRNQAKVIFIRDRHDIERLYGLRGALFIWPESALEVDSAVRCAFREICQCGDFKEYKHDRRGPEEVDGVLGGVLA